MPKTMAIRGSHMRSADNSICVMVAKTNAGKVVCIKNFDSDFPSCSWMKPAFFNAYPMNMMHKAEPKTMLGSVI